MSTKNLMRMSPFEPRRAFEHLDKLAYEIGPRLAGTRGERLAAEYIRKHFKSLGLRVRLQEFAFPDRLLRMRLSAVLLAGALLALLLPPPAGPALSASLVAITIGISRAVPKRRSANVIGALRPEKIEKRLTIAAHYDSSYRTRGRLLTLWVRLTRVPLMTILVILVALRAAGVLSEWPAWPVAWGALASVFLPTCIAMFMALERRVTPGANDNASGVAVMLEVARAVTESPPKGVELTFAGFGAEEQGLFGSKEFARRIQPKKTAVLNLDTVGTGSLFRYVRGNGIIRKLKTAEELNEELRRAGKNVGLRVEPMWAPLAGHDHIPLIRAGFPATTLTAADLQSHRLDRFIRRVFRIPDAGTRQYRHLHTLEDTPEQVELENIEGAGKITLEFIKVHAKETEGGEKSEDRTDVGHARQTRCS